MNNPHLLLSTEERNRFAFWLEFEAATSEGLIKQMETIPGTERVAKHMKMKWAAYLIVAKDIRRGTEEFLLGGPES